MTQKQMRSKSDALHFLSCFAVSREGMGGGLAMLRSSEVVVEIKSYSLHNTNVVVHSESGSYWQCTSVYGHPELAQKQRT